MRGARLAGGAQVGGAEERQIVVEHGERERIAGADVADAALGGVGDPAAVEAGQASVVIIGLPVSVRPRTTRLRGVGSSSG